MSDKDNAENYTERALKNFQCSIFFSNNDFQSSFYFIYLFLLFLILPGCPFKCYHLFSHEAQGRNVPNSLTAGMGFHCSYVPSSTAHKQRKVAILVLINTSAPIKFRSVENGN